MRIYLIGLPFSGKTFVGRALATKLNYDFIDINDEISKESLMFIDEIAERYGYKSIENVEEKLLKKYLKAENIIVATNANMVTNSKLKKYLDGLVIYLDVSDKILAKRETEGYTSYLLNNTTIEEYGKRLFLNYQNFATHIVANNREIDETIDEVIKIISKVENI